MSRRSANVSLSLNLLSKLRYQAQGSCMVFGESSVHNRPSRLIAESLDSCRVRRVAQSLLIRIRKPCFERRPYHEYKHEYTVHLLA